MERKYKLTEEPISFNGITLYRIEAIRDFSNIKKGDKGGFIESEYNLSHDGNAWVSDNAKVWGNAKVFEDAMVFGNAMLSGNAHVFGHATVNGNACVGGNANIRDYANVSNYAKVSGNAWVLDKASVFDKANVSGNAIISGYADVSGDANVCADDDYIVFKNVWSSRRHFTWTRSNNMWRVGCFYGSGEELIKKAYKDSQKSGREYERTVKYVESIMSD